ncbi:MAG: adaptor protein MecA [Eubacteriales bacterium]|nr:adaptor protein MecA [Eubacteriales bacterium]
MKIEKINENQIRCTLTRADLADRQLKLSELAYGTEKAKSLFHDMMQQAAHECGFEAEDIPLMIEAIPASADSIVLIITKVEDPEELDTRFSRFAPTAGSDWDTKRDTSSLKLEGAEDILNLLGKVRESLTSAPQETSPGTSDRKRSDLRLFSFAAMDSVICASQLLGRMYHGSNTLYKDTGADMYILALTQSDHTVNDFSRFCNMLSEYGSQENSSGATLAYLEEHCEVIISADAVQKLSQI